MCYRSVFQVVPGPALAVRATGDLNAIATGLRAIAHEIDPRLTLKDVVPFTEMEDRTLVIERMVAQVSAAFGVLADYRVYGRRAAPRDRVCRGGERQGVGRRLCEPYGWAELGAVERRTGWTGRVQSSPGPRRHDPGGYGAWDLPAGGRGVAARGRRHQSFRCACRGGQECACCY